MTTRRYSGYALRLAPPCTTKSSAHCHSASDQRAYACVVADFAQQVVRREAAAERAGDEMLDEDVGAAPAIDARLDASLAAAASRAAAASTSSSACVGTTVILETRAGLMAAAARALQQARDTFGLPICSTWSTGE